MADLLPSSPDPDAGDDGDPRVIGVDSDDADDLLAALQSDTARDLLAALYDDPATPSALADEVDTSIQNVRYHLEKLTDADLVDVTDTVYSEKGREMKVYAPAAKPLVVFAGSDDDTPGLEAALSRLLGGLGVLGLSSLLVQRFASGGPLAPEITFQSGNPDDDPSGGEAPEAATTASEESVTDGGTASAGDDAARTTAEEATTATNSSDGVGIMRDETEAAEETTRETVAEGTEVAADATRTVTEAMQTEEAAETVRTTTEGIDPTTVAEAAGGATGGLPPGLVFFAGGLVCLAALGVAWYLQAE